MLELLVKYGYYDDPVDILAVLKHLKDMLDGESDGECLYHQQSSGLILHVQQMPINPPQFVFKEYGGLTSLAD